VVKKNLHIYSYAEKICVILAWNFLEVHHRYVPSNNYVRCVLLAKMNGLFCYVIIQMCTSVHCFIFLCVCVCVCVCGLLLLLLFFFFFYIHSGK